MSKNNEKERVYEVKDGETLSMIGKKLNIKWQNIAKKNNIKLPYRVSPGTKLKY